jgi:hypothetical protein
MFKLVKNFALAILVLAGVTSSLQALPQGGFDTLYYSDDTYTDVVGERYVGCTGGGTMTGVRTKFYDSEGWSCQTADTTFCNRYYCYFVDQNGDPYDCQANNWSCWF